MTTLKRDVLYEIILNPCIQNAPFLDSSATNTYMLSFNEQELQQYERYCNKAWQAIGNALDNPNIQVEPDDFDPLFIFMATHHLSWLLANQEYMLDKIEKKLNSLEISSRIPGYIPTEIINWLNERKSSAR